MNTTFLLICYLTCLLGSLCALIIFKQNKFHTYYKTLVLLCLLFCIIVIGCWIFFQDKIPLMEYAYLWVIGFPLSFVPGCLLYLYVKSILTKKKSATLTDFLHLIPALLQTIEIIPFLNLSAAAKKAALTSYLLHPEKLEQTVFLLPLNAHTFLKATIWLIYIVLTICFIG